MWAEPDVINFGRVAGFLQIDQLVVNHFQQRGFAFLHPHADLFFTEQVWQDFEIGFIRSLCQQASQNGAVLSNRLHVAVTQGG
ncbi:hypothetical protein D3C86_1819690 [compost metagenome]